ncbi:hypothetical protein ARMGADRAFT_1087248 [Armillaria gallica]|uniref:Uncharacterized protein n=1 Tax=Armillaria gallica TaxID=47427 RepID=A0A2H3DDY7_ARMGA|nr:hypothetical protein ARMGADRAFT_1087248 [Armillaria gallica]
MSIGKTSVDPVSPQAPLQQVSLLADEFRMTLQDYGWVHDFSKDLARQQTSLQPKDGKARAPVISFQKDGITRKFLSSSRVALLWLMISIIASSQMSPAATSSTPLLAEHCFSPSFWMHNTDLNKTWMDARWWREGAKEHYTQGTSNRSYPMDYRAMPRDDGGMVIYRSSSRWFHEALRRRVDALAKVAHKLMQGSSAIHIGV